MCSDLPSSNETSARQHQRCTVIDEPRLVDERDISWESSNAVYRVTFFQASGPPTNRSYSTATYEMSGTFSEAQAWSVANAVDRPYMISIRVDDSPHGRGLVLLEGRDLNSPDEPGLA